MTVPLGRATMELAADLTPLRSGITSAQTLVRVALTGAATLAVRTIATAAIESERSMRRLEAVVRATGQAAGLTVAQLDGMAQTFQRTRLITDEAARDAITVLATFRGVQGEVFREGIGLALDLATAMRTDASSAALQLGKALQDPILGVTALRRAGVALNEAQQAQITSLVRLGDLQAAQKIILQELRQEFGGAGAAEAQGLAGAIHGATTAWDDFLEAIGRGEGILGRFIAAEARGLTRILQSLTPTSDAVTRQLQRIETLQAAFRRSQALGAEPTARFTPSGLFEAGQSVDLIAGAQTSRGRALQRQLQTEVINLAILVQARREAERAAKAAAEAARQQAEADARAARVAEALAATASRRLILAREIAVARIQLDASLSEEEAKAALQRREDLGLEITAVSDVRAAYAELDALLARLSALQLPLNRETIQAAIRAGPQVEAIEGVESRAALRGAPQVVPVPRDRGGELVGIFGTQDALRALADLRSRAVREAEAIGRAFESAADRIGQSIAAAAFTSENVLTALGATARAIIEQIVAGLVRTGLLQLATPLGITIPARAAGGSVDAGRLFRINEREPEFFVPSAPGRVVPLSQAGAQGLGATIQQTINLSTGLPTQILPTMQALARQAGAEAAVAVLGRTQGRR